uniref:Uncharacterized protein n=1 Tax=Romanomermis culicivorax TaxID=13658 RepID=A0A915HPJ5_ROMCU
HVLYSGPRLWNYLIININCGLEVRTTKVNYNVRHYGTMPKQTKVKGGKTFPMVPIPSDCFDKLLGPTSMTFQNCTKFQEISLTDICQLYPPIRDAKP